MNELLQKHGCSNVFTVPEGLKELMADITREVLRDQPPKIFDYIANYLSVLLITREHGIMAVKILDDLCDCKPSVSEHLLQHGIERSQAEALSQIIKEEVEGVELVEGKETVRETQILKKILNSLVLDEDMTAKVCQVARNAYRDYWYRKKLMEKNLKVHPHEPWEIAAERTLELYKRTKPSFSELTRATEKIQAAYKGYHVRRHTLRHLKPASKKKGPKVEVPGPPIDVADSREIDLGPVIALKVREEDTTGMFDQVVGDQLGLLYDPMKTIELVEGTELGGPSAMKYEESNSAKFGEPKTEDAPKIAKFQVESKLTTFHGEPEPKNYGSASEGLANKNVSSRVGMDMTGLSRTRQKSEEIAPVDEDISEVVAVGESGSARFGSKHMHTAETSFAKKPVEYERSSDVPEEILDVEAKITEASEAAEVPETELKAAAIEDDDFPEVPEEIPDDRTEGEESGPMTSFPSSVPDTANSTDVEDAGDMAEYDEE